MSAHAYELRHVVSSIFWGEISRRCGEWSQFHIFLNMPPTRVCADCSATVNRKSVCTCGHVFTPKKGGPLSLRKSKRVAVSMSKRLLSNQPGFFQSEAQPSKRDANFSLFKLNYMARGTRALMHQRKNYFPSTTIAFCIF